MTWNNSMALSKPQAMTAVSAMNTVLLSECLPQVNFLAID
jgi:hypothetical protein